MRLSLLGVLGLVWSHLILGHQNEKLKVKRVILNHSVLSMLNPVELSKRHSNLNL